MSDTPETDAEAITPSGFEADEVPAEFARKLERERDEARKELEEYRSIAENIGADKAVSEKEKAIRERDEAREELEEAQLCLKKAITELDLASVEIFKWERDFMIVVNDFKTVVKQLNK